MVEETGPRGARRDAPAPRRAAPARGGAGARAAAEPRAPRRSSSSRCARPGCRSSCGSRASRPSSPPGVDLTAYRIVQEGLTNALKHAQRDAAPRCIVRYDDGAVELVVTRRRRRATATGDGGGHGLVGMRERVAVYGGELDAGPRPERRLRAARAAAGRRARHERPRPDRRRPGARADGLPHDPRGRAGHRGRRRGGRRASRRSTRRARLAAGRRPDGRPHARARRHRGDAAPARRRRQPSRRS